MPGARTHTATPAGVIQLGVDLADGLPGTTITGLPGTSMREARDRIRAAVINSGHQWPQCAITISLTPAVPASSSDVAIAVAMIAAADTRYQPVPDDILFLAELGLDGSLRPVRDVLPAVTAAAHAGFVAVIVAPGNEHEAATIPGIRVLTATHLAAVAAWLRGTPPSAGCQPVTGHGPAWHASLSPAKLPDPDALLEAALGLARRGWHVFPCQPGTKRPALRDWEHRATTEPDRIARCWTRHQYNIGIACGPSGLVVLDLDLDQPEDPQLPPAQIAAASGTGTLARLCQRHGQPYPGRTFTVQTPSGGQHLYFTSPATTLRNTAGRLGPHIDTRANGGYVVAPASRIGESYYQVTNLAPPVPLPSWLTALLSDPGPPQPRSATASQPGPRTHAHRYALAALRAEVQRVTTAAAGTRNDTLNRAAFAIGQLTATGLLPSSLACRALTDAARQTGLPARETQATIRSGMAAGMRKPRQAASRPRRQDHQLPGPQAQADSRPTGLDSTS